MRMIKVSEYFQGKEGAREYLKNMSYVGTDTQAGLQLT